MSNGINFNSGTPGRKDGTAISAGFIGEIITNSTAIGVTTVNATINIGSISVPPGIWDIYGTTFNDKTAGTGSTKIHQWISSVSGQSLTVNNLVEGGGIVEKQDDGTSPLTAYGFNLGPVRINNTTGANLIVYTHMYMTATTTASTAYAKMKAVRVG